MINSKIQFNDKGDSCSLFLTLIFRKYDEKNDLEVDQDGDQTNLNEYKKLSDFKMVKQNFFCESLFTTASLIIY